MGAATNGKTPSQTPSTRPAQQRGLRIGNPGNKGGGRLPDEFKQRLSALVSSDASLEFLESCLTQPQMTECPHCKQPVPIPVPLDPESYFKAFDRAADRGIGKVPTPVAIEGKAELTIRVVRERREVRPRE